MSKPIIAIAANITRKKKVYVTSAIPREDGRLIPSTSFNHNDAKDFKSMEEAWEAVGRFHNLLGRDYQPETVEVNRELRTPTEELV